MEETKRKKCFFWKEKKRKKMFPFGRKKKEKKRFPLGRKITEIDDHKSKTSQPRKEIRAKRRTQWRGDGYNGEKT